MKRKIAIVAGGYSSEQIVSLKSAETLYSFIDKERYDVEMVIITTTAWNVRTQRGEMLPIHREDFSYQQAGIPHRFDFAYITIHGTPGEDGLLQGYFEMIGIPYSCCGVLASALTFNKYFCNNYLRGFGIRVAPSLLLRARDRVTNARVVEQLGLPCFIKPNVGGSSFGTTKVKHEQEIQPAITAAFAEGAEVIIEAFMQGTEITCGCYKTRTREHVLPITEVVSQNEFFDYEAKYNGKVTEITPARLTPQRTDEIQTLTSRIYDLLGCKGVIRVDYIIVDDIPHLLEVNTTPGMTATSFIPQQVAAAGMTMTQLMTDVIEDNF